MTGHLQERAGAAGTAPPVTRKDGPSVYEDSNSQRQAGTTPSRVKVKGERGIYTRQTNAGRRYEFIYQDSTGRTRWQTCTTLKEARQGRASKVAALARGERVAP